MNKAVRSISFASILLIATFASANIGTNPRPDPPPPGHQPNLQQLLTIVQTVLNL